MAYLIEMANGLERACLAVFATGDADRNYAIIGEHLRDLGRDRDGAQIGVWIEQRNLTIGGDPGNLDETVMLHENSFSAGKILPSLL
jgi:hypothetical protein